MKDVFQIFTHEILNLKIPPLAEPDRNDSVCLRMLPSPLEVETLSCLTLNGRQ